MIISPLASMAAVTAGKVVGQVVEKISEKISFKSFLHPLESQSEETTKTDGSSSLSRSPGFLGSSTLRLENLQEVLKQFHQEIRQLLAQQGKDTSLSYKLQGNSLGGVEVVGDHPYKAEIEQLFRDNPELNHTFNRLSGNFSLLRAVQRHQTFSRQYERDPLLAGQILPELIEQNSSDRFGLTINGEEFEVSFD